MKNVKGKVICAAVVALAILIYIAVISYITHVVCNLIFELIKIVFLGMWNESRKMEELDRAIMLAIKKYKESNEVERLEEGDEFVTIFNNCCLYVALNNNKLVTKFLQKPDCIDMSISFYETEDE